MPELSETDASGEIAAIYAEIRRLWAVPYVSSMQRHLATRPGWLEWVWTALRPAFASGRAQEAAWRAADGLEVPPLDPISRDALRVWDVDAAGERVIRTVCQAFIRVSPVNLVFSGLLQRLLQGERPHGPGLDTSAWQPPPALARLPEMVDPAGQSTHERAVMLSLATVMADQPFVPGIYRMLARWPRFLGHVATVLPPRLDRAAAGGLSLSLCERIDALIPAIFSELPPPPVEPPVPRSSEFASVLDALATYRTTSPEMVIAGRLIADALPSSETAPETAFA